MIKNINKMTRNIYLSTIEYKKQKRQNRNRLIDTKNILTVARWEELGGTGENGEGIKKYKLVVTE